MKKSKKKSQTKSQKQPTGIELQFGKRLHPLAEKVPDRTELEFTELVDDIKANGLRDPITLDYTGKYVVDGRGRLLACEQGDVNPKFVKLPKNSNIAQFIISRLIHRSLTASQRAAIAAELMSALKGGVKNDTGKGKARAKAAKALHVSEGYVHEAAKLKKEDPEKFEDVKKGKTTLAKARPKKATPKKDKPVKVVEIPDEPKQAPVEQQMPVEGADAKVFGIWEQALRYLLPFVSCIDSLQALGEPVGDLVVGARAVQKQFAKVRQASCNGAVAVVS